MYLLDAPSKRLARERERDPTAADEAFGRVDLHPALGAMTAYSSQSKLQ